MTTQPPIIAIAIVLSVLFIGRAPSAAAQTIPQAVAAARDVFAAGSYTKRMMRVFSSEITCRARGFSPEVCRQAAVMCAINDAAGTLYGRIDTLLDAFQTDCGNGICFACCFTGKGCHTSFYDPEGDEVINCTDDGGYGPIAYQAGPTLVVDPDAKPSDACLFVEQTCDHLALCTGGRSPAEIERINNDATHVMKSAPAAASRARNFATMALGAWSQQLSAYHTSAPAQSDRIRTNTSTFYELGSFVSGRGCVGWRQRFPAGFGSDWSDPQFRIVDEAGVYAEEASHYNAVRQLGLTQFIAGIPNLYNRLRYVESRIWTPDAIQKYLASIGDADATYLRTMSPLALRVLRSIRGLQDYRLLAVPLPGEVVPARFYAGCTLGESPSIQLVSSQRGTLGVEANVTSTAGVDVLVLWGDGAATTAVTNTAGMAAVTHEYAVGGKYQLIIIAQNDSGLQTIAGGVAQTRSITTGATNVTPVVSEVQLVDVRATVDAFAGNAGSLVFEIQGYVPGTTAALPLGISRALEVRPEVTTPFGTIAGWNTVAAPIRSVTIRPSLFEGGLLLGFRSTYFTLERLRVGIYSTERHRLNYYDVPITRELIRLYPIGSEIPVELSTPTYDTDGRLRIPLQTSSTRYGRIEILFPDSFYTVARQQPISDPTWRAFTGTIPELLPDFDDYVPLRRRAVRH
jgi:hypothetical protein